MKTYKAYIVANGKETPIKNLTAAHKKVSHCFRVYEIVQNAITGDDEYIIAEFYGEKAKLYTEEFLNVVDPTRKCITALGHYLSTDSFEELEDAYYKLTSVIDKNKPASEYVEFADFVSDSMTVKELLNMVSFVE
jgi:hypothetical protein